MLQQQKAEELKRKAVESQERFCHILKKKVTILTEYIDYKSAADKGEAGSIYCGNIIPCYHNDVKCKYSGISPLFRDPFIPDDEEPEISPN